MKYDNQPDPEKPLAPGRQHIAAELTCREETIADNIRRGELTIGLKDRKMETPAGIRITEATAYFWHPLSVCCSAGTIFFDGTEHNVQDLSLDEFAELPGALNKLWQKELTDANPDLFNEAVVDQKKSTNS